jgi:hypothetical protein
MRTSACSQRVVALLLWGAVVLLGASVLSPAEAGGQGTNHAGLVVDFGDGRTETYCVEFTEDEISGAELLQRSGLPVVFSGSSGFGSGICRIDDTGCSDPGDCFCQCRGAECRYWSYFGLEDGEWRYQALGASTRRLQDGDVDAWVWGDGRTAPPVSSADDACQPAAGPTATRVRQAQTPNVGQPTVPLDAGSGGAAPTDVGVQAPAPVAGPQTMRASPPPGSTPEATPLQRSAAAREDAAGAGGAREERAQRSDESGDGSDSPRQLIAFGAVAGALAAATAAIVVRKRLRAS